MLLEVCIDCVESALAAQSGGAQRIEICGALASGGTTPSLGLIRQCVQRCQISAVAMIRPHDGGFVYSEDDLLTMLDDIAAVKTLGIQGIVLGALTADGDLDLPAMERLVEAAGDLEITFHRAFDVIRNPLKSLDQIMDLGIDRLLTSGQATTAEKGAALIGQLVDSAAGGITVMAGAGINSSNVKEIIKATGVTEVHASASRPRTPEFMDREVRFGDASRVTSDDAVRELAAAII